MSRSTRIRRTLAALFSVVTAAASSPVRGADRETFTAVDTSALLGSPDPPPIAEAVVAFPHLRFEF
ncbi:MAG: hypothetical protein L0170_16730, partial [Acidobacteria bacterium]|nr:hypothetical protein [Acidobacteriota bacterium]